MSLEVIKQQILDGKTSLGIEFGSTRIKAVLVDGNYEPIASGSHDWENRLVDHIWTYTLEDVWGGLQDCYSNLKKDVEAKYGVKITKFGAIGFSAMMHGYMAFNKEGELLVPFRTWRNTMTEEASNKLTEVFNYHIPQRWSIAHLYQAILNKEEHVGDVDFFTTLAGYVHWKLTGKKVLGVGEASGMFPIDLATKKFNTKMQAQFNELVSGEEKISWKLENIMPEVLVAGEEAGILTKEGASLLDPAGDLEAGIPLCPPEGDAGTGMTATNSVAVRTGNVSAGTSVFAMVVLEKELSKVYDEIDLVTTPTGNLVGMVHCNNCTSDLNAWVNLFAECLESFGCKPDMNTIYGTLYNKALTGDADCGGLLAYNYFSGEHITGFEEGRPMFVRKPDSNFNLANFMRTHLFTSLGALKVGLDILLKEENVKIDKMLGHGGLYKTKGVGQKITAAAMNAPVSVMETAGEGGAWGIALLAAYMTDKNADETLEKFLEDRVFAGMTGTTENPDSADVEGFDKFMLNYRNGLAIERAAVDSIK